MTEANVSIGGAENYASADPSGFGMYLFQIVFGIIFVVILWKKVGKTIDFEEIRKTW